MFFDSGLIDVFGDAATNMIDAGAGIAGLGITTAGVISAVKNEENREAKLAAALIAGSTLGG